MNIMKWLPYIPFYPNTRTSQIEKTTVRFVEPSTRTDVKMTPTEEWHERIERLREFQRNKSVTTYGPNGAKTACTIKPGQLFSFYV